MLARHVVVLVEAIVAFPQAIAFGRLRMYYGKIALQIRNAFIGFAIPTFILEALIVFGKDTTSMAIVMLLLETVFIVAFVIAYVLCIQLLFRAATSK